MHAPTRPAQPIATDDSTVWEKLTVCGMAFGFSCLGFFAAAIILLPATAWLFGRVMGAPEALIQILSLGEIIALPIVAAIYGIYVGGQALLQNRLTT